MFPKNCSVLKVVFIVFDIFKLDVPWPGWLDNTWEPKHWEATKTSQGPSRHSPLIFKDNKQKGTFQLQCTLVSDFLFPLLIWKLYIYIFDWFPRVLAFPQRNFSPCRLFTSVVFATQRALMFKQSKLPNMRLRKYIKHLNIFIVSLLRSYRFERATWPVSILKNPTLWTNWRQQIKYTQGQQSCVNLIFSSPFGDPKKCL